MKLITRSEEMVLLAILQLKDKAYGVTIQKELNRLAGKTWAFGALFVTLDRLSKKGLVASALSDPTPERGGRRKRMYRLTPKAIDALKTVREHQRAVWKKAPSLSTR